MSVGAPHRSRRARAMLVLGGLAAVALALAPGGARSATAGPFREFPPAQFGSGENHPFLITKAGDGRLWYTVQGSGTLEAMTTAGAATGFPFVGLNDPRIGGSGLSTGIAAAPGGTVDFLQQGQAPNAPTGAAIGVGTDVGTRVQGPLATREQPNQIAPGPDGNLWYTTNGYVCKATPTLGDQNCQSLGDTPVGGEGIVAGADDAVWLTERTGNAIYRITPDFDHREFPLPTAGAAPYGITLGRDGALWFTETAGNRIGRITTDGRITEFPLPNAGSNPMGITQGPDGALWFAESAGNRIGRITTDGRITEYTVPTRDSGPRGIVTGPDGALWFTEETAGRIGRFDPSPAASLVPSTPAPGMGRIVALDPSGSAPRGGTITRFAYDFDGSGRYDTVCPPSAPVAYKAFDTPGSHVIGLRVTDSQGLQSTTQVAVNVLRGAGVRARTARNPALDRFTRFWCGTSADERRLDLGYLTPRLTSEVHAVGIDVTQGTVPDPPRPSVLSQIAKSASVKALSASAAGTSVAPGYYALNNDKQDPRVNRIKWLQRYGTTVVRVYASALLAPNGASVPNVQMKLYGFRDGHPLPGSPLVSQTGPLTVPLGPPFTTHAMRVGYSPADGSLPAFTYTLPHDWVSGEGNVALLAVPQLVGPRLDRQCGTLPCKRAEQAWVSKQFGSGDLQFNYTGLFIVRSVAMTAKGDPALPDPSSVFGPAANITPVATLASPYQGTVDITPITTCKAGDKSQPCTDPNGWVTGQIGNWLANNQPVVPATVKVATIGVHKGHGQAQGYSSWPGTCPDNSVWGGAICESSSNSPVSQVEVNRPLTSVAHEMQHDLGRPHADDSSSGCGGNGEGKPDAKGQMLSIGLDRRPGSGGSLTNPYKILAPGNPGQPSAYYDPMSYCASTAEGDSWASAHNWDELASEWIFFLKRAAASSVLAPAALATSSASGAALQVTGMTEGAATHITQVQPAGRAAAAASAAAAPAYSPIRAVARGAGGAVVGNVPLSFTTGHLDSGRRGVPETPVIFFHGVVPAGGAASVEVLRSGSVAATRARSAHAPRVRLLAPRRGTIGRGRTVAVRWSATDADGGLLSSSVDYSADGGRRWRTVLQSTRGSGAARLPSRYFTGSRDARVRVRVNDGFNQGVATSGRLRAIGSPPAVRITAPRSGQRYLSDASVYLAGSAFDDAFRRLGGRSLRWYAGRRRVGTGEGATVSGLAPGLVRIRLVARDRRGRAASASIRVRVSAASPFFTSLLWPGRIRRGARSLVVRVATNEPALLGAGGKRYRVGPRIRRLRVTVPRGSRSFTLRLSLSAYGRRATRSLAVAR